MLQSMFLWIINLIFHIYSNSCAVLDSSQNVPRNAATARRGRSPGRGRPEKRVVTSRRTTHQTRVTPPPPRQLRSGKISSRLLHQMTTTQCQAIGQSLMMMRRRKLLCHNPVSTTLSIKPSMPNSHKYSQRIISNATVLTIGLHN